MILELRGCISDLNFGIESFWSFTKRRLSQFNGLRDEMFYLHLKESEFRFNNRHNDIYAILLKNLRENNL